MAKRRPAAPAETTKRDDEARAVALVERTLPHNLEAERSCLGAVLVHNDAWEHMRGIIGEEDFYRDAHKRIWRAMKYLNEQKVDIDFVTIKNELARVGNLDEVGGPAYIASMADGVPRATNVKYYAGIVREKALLRDLIYAANRTLTSAYEGEEPAIEIIKATDRELTGLQRGRRGSNMSAQSATINDLFATIAHRVENKGKLIGIPTGFQSIDDLTMGWRRKDYIVHAARPSIGKTTFIDNSATYAAWHHNIRTAMFNFEMSRQQLDNRRLSMISGVPSMRIEGGYLGGPDDERNDYRKIAEALEVMSTLPLHIDDRRGQTVDDIRNACKRVASEFGELHQVVIDYIQLIPGNLARRGANRNDELTYISRQLSEMADELNVVMHVLSQLRRKDRTQRDPRPSIDDLRDCGALEQDAGTIVLLHRPNHREGGPTACYFDKMRNGPTGTRVISLDRDVITFTDAPDQEVPESPRRERKGKKNPLKAEPDLPLDESTTSD